MNNIEEVRAKIAATGSDTVVIRVTPSLAVVARDGRAVKVVASVFNRAGRRVIADLTPRTFTGVKEAISLYRGLVDLFDLRPEEVIVKQLL